MTKLLGRIIAALVFALFGFLGALIALAVGDVLFELGTATYEAHPVLPLVCSAIAASYGFTRT